MLQNILKECSFLSFCARQNFLKIRKFQQNFLKSGNFLNNHISDRNIQLHKSFLLIKLCKKRNNSYRYKLSQTLPKSNPCKSALTQLQNDHLIHILVAAIGIAIPISLTAIIASLTQTTIQIIHKLWSSPF